MDWLLLALLAPILWSIVVLIDDHLVQRVYPNSNVGAIISGFFGLLPMVSLIWLSTQPADPKVVLAGLASGFLTIIYYFFYFRALEVEVPSVVIALMSLTPASLPFLAHYLLDEALTISQIVGFAVVLFFTLVLAVVDIKKFKFSKALVPIFFAVVLMDFALISGKYAYEGVEFYTAYMYFSAGMGFAAFFLLGLLYSGHLFKKTKKRPAKKSYMYIIVAFFALALAELINIAAEFTSNLAISKGPVSLVGVIQNTQPMYMLLIAVLLYPFFPKYFREVEDGRIKFKLVAMTGIIVGVAITILG